MLPRCIDQSLGSSNTRANGRAYHLPASARARCERLRSSWRTMTGRHSSRALAALPRSSGYLAALGVCLAMALPFEAGAYGLAIALGSALLAALWRHLRLAVIAVAASVFMLAAWWWSWSCWPASADGERVRTEAVIDSLVTLRNGALEFDADVTLVSGVARGRTLRARIVWRAPPRPWPAAGERWQLLLQLRAPRVPALGARDAAREAFRDGIHARATVIASPLDRVVC
ncbi:MAG: DUF4131 domain-containing protein [Gammaproteobacteria bacterium]|nr:DUF4131 domain-containing protein [Gammaproteobacteria bacterium]